VLLCVSYGVPIAVGIVVATVVATLVPVATVVGAQHFAGSMKHVQVLSASQNPNEFRPTRYEGWFASTIRKFAGITGHAPTGW